MRWISIDFWQRELDQITDELVTLYAEIPKVADDKNLSPLINEMRVLEQLKARLERIVKDEDTETTNNAEGSPVAATGRTLRRAVQNDLF